MTYRTNGDYTEFTHGLYELSQACQYEAAFTMFWTNKGQINQSAVNGEYYRQAYWDIQAHWSIIKQLADKTDLYVDGMPKSPWKEF